MGVVMMSNSKIKVITSVIVRRIVVYKDYTSVVEAVKANDTISPSFMRAEMVFLDDLMSLDKKILSLHHSSLKAFKSAFLSVYGDEVSLNDFLAYLRSEIKHLDKRYGQLKGILRKYK